jgi:hypothetical protein
MKKLEAVTVCVGFGDFLAVTAPANINLFDRWVIVTTPGDSETREVCRKLSLPTLLTEEFYRDGAEFNKGRGIAMGLDQIEGADWIMQLDSDIVLPPDLRNWLDRAHLDPSCCYGCDRVMVKSWQDWQKLRETGYLQHDYHCRCNFPAGYEVGTRWVSPTHSWVPIGFVQLWHGSAATLHGFHQKAYPDWHNSASRADVQFGLQWDRRKRALLPEVIAIHLESGPAGLGANWKGRTTPRFGPASSGNPKSEISNPKPGPIS